MVDSIIKAEQIVNPDLKDATLTNIKSELLEILFDYSSRFQTKYETAKVPIREKLLEEGIDIDNHKEFIESSLIPFYAKLSAMYKSCEEMFEDLNERTKLKPCFIVGIKIGVTVSFDNLYYTFSKKEIESYDVFERCLLREMITISGMVISEKERELKIEGLEESDFEFLDEQHRIANEYFCYFSQFL